MTRMPSVPRQRNSTGSYQPPRLEQQAHVDEVIEIDDSDNDSSDDDDPLLARPPRSTARASRPQARNQFMLDDSSSSDSECEFEG